MHLPCIALRNDFYRALTMGRFTEYSERFPFASSHKVIVLLNRLTIRDKLAVWPIFLSTIVEIIAGKQLKRAEGARCTFIWWRAAIDCDSCCCCRLSIHLSVGVVGGVSRRNKAGEHAVWLRRRAADPFAALQYTHKNSFHMLQLHPNIMLRRWQLISLLTEWAHCAN